MKMITHYVYVCDDYDYFYDVFGDFFNADPYYSFNDGDSADDHYFFAYVHADDDYSSILIDDFLSAFAIFLIVIFLNVFDGSDVFCDLNGKL